MQKPIKMSTPKGSLTLDHWEHLKNLIQIHSSFHVGSRKYYEKMGLQYVDVPAIVGITGACENVDTLFKVGNRLGLPLFFTQTGQLALEQALQKFSGMWTIIYSGRDEEIEDKRHLRQFKLTEEEFDWTTVSKGKKYDEDQMFEFLLQHIEGVVKNTVARILSDHKQLIVKVYKRKVVELERAITDPFNRITYTDGVKLLQENGYPNLVWGDDLKADHEQSIVELFAKKREDKVQLPTFITKYPQEIKFFNMKEWTQDPKVVLSADLILPIAGESAGSAVREHDGDKLRKRLLGSNMFRLHKERGGSYDDFTWYTEDIVAAGKSNPHAGYGLGNERVLQYILGVDDIRQASVISLMAQESHDWDTERRGKAHLISHQKTTLLTIGRITDKRLLLPVIKLAQSSNNLFFATEGTHKFLAANGVPTTLVYKISENGKPNLGDLIAERKFDLIINIPNRDKSSNKSMSDGKLIRRGAVDTGTHLITDMEVAYDTLDKLGKMAK